MTFHFALAQILLALLIGVQLWTTRSATPTIRALTQLQSIYTTLALIVRPIYQTLLQPGYGDYLYDPRLLTNQYVSLGDVSWIAVAGQAAFVGIITLSIRLFPTSTRAPYEMVPWGSFTTAISIAYVAIDLARVTQLVAPALPTYLLVPFGTPLACLTLVTLPSLTGKVKAAAAALIISELAWSLVSASKTPVIAVLAALLMRTLIHGTTRSRRRSYLTLATAGVAAFLVIQPLKGSTTQDASEPTLAAAAEATANAVLERFDGMNAITDAYYFPSQPWMSASEFVSTALASVNPLLRTDDTLSVGIRWTQQVRSASVPYQFQDVPIAAGPTAEGYALGGLFGSLIENSISAAALILTGIALSRGPMVRRIYTSYFAFSTVLFEIGTLGLISGNFKAIQFSLFMVVLFALFRPLATPANRRSSRNLSGRLAQ